MAALGRFVRNTEVIHDTIPIFHFSSSVTFSSFSELASVKCQSLMHEPCFSKGLDQSHDLNLEENRSAY